MSTLDEEDGLFGVCSDGLCGLWRRRIMPPRQTGNGRALGAYWNVLYFSGVDIGVGCWFICGCGDMNVRALPGSHDDSVGPDLGTDRSLRAPRQRERGSYYADAVVVWTQRGPTSRWTHTQKLTYNRILLHWIFCID